MSDKSKTWDVFISHASEDKEDIARPLAKTLAEMGANVWFDENEIALGDSLSRTIDAGLSKSNFGIVILSKHFLEKNWPEYELRSLVAKEIGSSKVILPIWHRIGRDDILKFSPALADKLALSSNLLDIDQICIKILSVIRPDLLTALNRKIAHKLQSENSEVNHIDVNLIKYSAARHKKLPDDLMGRIRLVRSALMLVYPHSFEFWVDGFRSDAHPTQEVAIWEHMAAVFTEVSQVIDETHHKDLFAAVAGLGMGNGELSQEDKERLPPEIINILIASYFNTAPAIEVDEIPYSEQVELHNTDHLLIDKESFESDVSKISKSTIDRLSAKISTNKLFR